MSVKKSRRMRQSETAVSREPRIPNRSSEKVLDELGHVCSQMENTQKILHSSLLESIQI